MFGRLRRSSYGQLALMDAILFFLTAIAISNLILQSMRFEGANRPNAEDFGQSDAGTILQVFFHASLGREMTLQIDEKVRIQRDSEIVECLSIELLTLDSGRRGFDFEPLNSAFLEVLRSVCNPLYEPYLLALVIREETSRNLLQLPSEPPESNSRYAASAELPSLNGGWFLVELVLVPAFLSETS